MSPTATTTTITPTTETTTSSQCSECNGSAIIGSPDKRKKQLGPYLLLDTLSLSDEYSKTKRAVHVHTGKEVAVKLINKARVEEFNLRDKVDLEISILKRLIHPSIVKLFDVIETQTHVGLVMEYAPEGELFEYVVKNDYVEESKAQVFFAQLISSVHYMHRKQVVHRDLKLENLILVDDQHLLVTGFGFANRCEGDLLSTCCGSPCYAAPELLLRTEYVGPAIDIWSCGVVLYTMLCGYLPFEDRGFTALKNEGNVNLLYQDMLEAALTFPPRVSEDARDLLRQMLEPDPAFRCSIDVVMAHPWLAAHRALLEKPMHVLEEEATKTITENRQATTTSATVTTSTNSNHGIDSPVPTDPDEDSMPVQPAVATTTHTADAAPKVSRVTISAPPTPPSPSPSPPPTKQPTTTAASASASTPVLTYYTEKQQHTTTENHHSMRLFGSLRKFIRRRSKKAGRKGVFSFIHHSNNDNNEPCTRVQFESLLVFRKMTETQLESYLTQVLGVLGINATTHNLKFECTRSAAPHSGAIYGDNESRQSVTFMVEICVAAAASHGLRMIDVRRINGEESAYEFLCGKVLDTLEMLIKATTA